MFINSSYQEVVNMINESLPAVRDISALAQDLYRNPIRDSVGHELYDGLHDIVIDGVVKETADIRRARFSHETSDPKELKEIYLLEAKIDELGERLGFCDIGSYDSIHLLRMFSKNDSKMKTALDSFDPKSINTIEDYHHFIERTMGGYVDGIIQQ